MERFPKKKESKEALWNKEKEIVDHLTDALGLGIDEGIKDTVIALRLLDINTRSSHEGKLDRYPIPYVDVTSKQGERLLSEYRKKVEELRSPEQKELMQEIDHLYDQIKLLSEDDTEEVQNILKQRDELERRVYMPQSEELNELREQIIAANEQENNKLQSLLEEFYTNRNIPADSRLHITDGPMGQGRLEPVATEVQEQETDAQKTAERLKEFQSEMHEFTEFLKKRFYELKG